MSNYTRLSASGMRTISAHWLRDEEVHAFLSAHPKTAALLPDVTEAHDALCVALGGEDNSPIDEQIQALGKEGAVLDERHDRKYRGTWKLIDALVELTDKPETAESLLAVRDKLQPGGLPQVNASWIDEAGNAATVRQDLDKATRAELKRIPSIEGRTLDDEVQAWVKAGEALGPVAAKKAALEHQLANPEDGADSQALRAARLQWIRIARALESNLDLVKKISSEDRGKVLGLLHQAAANAERRSAARRKPEPAPAPAPTPPKPA